MTRKETLQFAKEVYEAIAAVYPDRDLPSPFVPTRTALIEILETGVDPLSLIRAARQYRTHCEREGTPPKYRIGMTRFYRDGIWQHFDVPTVQGRTREEWARSGQDVAEFDRMAQGGAQGGSS